MENEVQNVAARLTIFINIKTINTLLKYSSGEKGRNSNSKNKKEEKKEKNKENNIKDNIKEKKVDNNIKLNKEEKKEENINNNNIKDKKEEKKKEEDSNININNITNNNNSHNIYVINNYFEDKKNKINSLNNTKIGLWKDGKRYDRNGIEIKKGGKQKLSYLDRIGKGRLVDTIAIESFKEYNLIEEVSDHRKNNCCFVF